MKDILTRLLIYCVIALALIAIFNAWPTVPEYLPLSNRIARYIGDYAVPVAAVAVIGETVHLIRNARRNRRGIANDPTKELDDDFATNRFDKLP
jgi:hypothetical protein